MIVALATMVALCAMVGNFVSDGRRVAPGLGGWLLKSGDLLRWGFVQKM